MKKPAKKSPTTKSTKPAKTAAVSPKETVRKPAPTVRKPAPRPTFTVVTAQIDVGFGNTLYIRGEGGGLNWEAGVAMTCAADDAWTVKLPVGSGPVTFKFLLNDLIWCNGENFVVAPGAKVTLTPMF
jgi:hypothetical protein